MFRVTDCNMWRDGWFGDLSPEAQHVFMYLFSSPDGSACGAFKITPKIIAGDTNRDRSTIETILAELCKPGKDGKTRVTWWPETEFVFVHKFYHHQKSNGFFEIAAAKSAMACPEFVKELILKTYPEFIPVIENQIARSQSRKHAPKAIDTVSTPSQDPIDTVSTPHRHSPVQYQDQYQNQDQISEPESETDSSEGESAHPANPITLPTLSEAEAYLFTIGCGVEQGQEFLDYMELEHWEFNGKPILDWRVSARRWKSNYERFRARDRAKGRGSPASQSFEDLANENIRKIKEMRGGGP
jgi:hypothetical protein